MKVLDINGVQYLWQKINMQDYPNNDLLIAVIDAIDQGKADKIHSHKLSDLELGTMPFIILQSPNGTNFKLSVDDNGVLITTQIEN